MNKLNRLIALVLVLGAASCQKRTVCHYKLSTGGVSYARVYANTYSTPEEYSAAVAALKDQGYACDDSAALN
jgi:hypothetical protein